MRVYFTTTIPRAESIIESGWRDWYTEFGLRGVYLSGAPLDANDGFSGDVVLCLDVPDEVLARYNVADEATPAVFALVPAGELNKLGKPRVYDHDLAGLSRRELLHAIRGMEDRGRGGRKRAREMRAALAFFDKIGWLTPLRLQEERGRG
jgi:hypothetical protein